MSIEVAHQVRKNQRDLTRAHNSIVQPAVEAVVTGAIEDGVLDHDPRDVVESTGSETGDEDSGSSDDEAEVRTQNERTTGISHSET